MLLNHEGLWHWGRKDPLPDVSSALPETRRLMDEGHYDEASWKLANALRERGYGTKLASRFPLAAIQLRMPGSRAFREYRRTLDMETGEVSVRWSDGAARYARRLFVSRADSVVVYDIRPGEPVWEDSSPSGARAEREGDPGDGGGKLRTVSGEIGLILYPSDRWGDSPEFKELADSVTIQAEGCYIRYAARNDDGEDFGAVLRIICEDGRVHTGKEGTTIRFEAMRKALVLVKVFVGGRREDQWKRLEQELAALLDACEYERLLQRHAELHGPLFHSAALELSGAPMTVAQAKSCCWRLMKARPRLRLPAKCGRMAGICSSAGRGRNRVRSGYTAYGAVTTVWSGAIIWQTKTSR